MKPGDLVRVGPYAVYRLDIEQDLTDYGMAGVVVDDAKAPNSQRWGIAVHLLLPNKKHGYIPRELEQVSVEQLTEDECVALALWRLTHGT